jgi:hypothetical protein
MSETVQIISAVATGIVAIIAAYGAIQTRKVHTIVNSQRDVMLAKIEELKEELRQDNNTSRVPPLSSSDD